MARIGIVGHTGFVGKYLLRAYPHAVCFNSRNSSDMAAGVTVDVLFIAGVSAVKWKANAEPDADLAAIRALLLCLEGVKVTRGAVVVSTIDVFGLEQRDIGSGSDEDTLPMPGDAYGRNRLFFEQECRRLFPVTMTIRLPGLFGHGLKKNVIFDALRDDARPTLSSSSFFQWYSMAWFETDVRRLVAPDTSAWPSVVHLFPEPLSAHDMCDVLFPSSDTSDASDTFDIDLQAPRYDVQTRLMAEAGTRYWRSRGAVVAAMRRFADAHRSVVLSTLSGGTHSVIEVAPHQWGMVAPLADPAQFRGRGIYSFQSLFYPLDRDPEWCDLANNFEGVWNRLAGVITMAGQVGAKVLVFGAPRIRAKADRRPWVMRLFRLAAPLCLRAGVRLCLEPNASAYGCEVVTTVAEGAAFIREAREGIACPEAAGCIQLMLDTGCVEMEGQDVLAELEHYAPELGHVHFSMPNLAPLNSDRPFAWWRLRARQAGYRGRFTVEMLPGPSPSPSATSIWDAAIHEVARDPVVQVAGAGWVGCHMAVAGLARGFAVSISDTEQVFAGVSRFNQNRLHIGFHYPRCHQTRDLCRRTFDTFVAQYGAVEGLLSDVPGNVYAVHRESHIDAHTYRQIMQAEGLEFQTADAGDFGIEGCYPDVTVVREKRIDPDVAAAHFERVLSQALTVGHDGLAGAHRGDPLVDATYNALGHMDTDATWANTLSVIYDDIRDDPTLGALTVMDGAFFSIYPYNSAGQYTLTHVTLGLMSDAVSDAVSDDEEKKKAREGVIERTIDAMEAEARRVLPSFDSSFRRQGYFVSRKCKRAGASDPRHMVAERFGATYSYMTGKISGVYDAEQNFYAGM